jgi:hypothetical protein
VCVQCSYKHRSPIEHVMNRQRGLGDRETEGLRDSGTKRLRDYAVRIEQIESKQIYLCDLSVLCGLCV